jgi:DNA-binding response OmpR family regulator
MKSKKALIIDDEKIVLDSINTILSAEGYAVDLAQSSRKGLDLAITGEYDIVLSDVRMPEIGGMRVLRDIKRAKPALPVVIVTGYATVQSAVQAMKLGAADYVEKPFTPEELTATVTQAIKRAADEEPEEPGIIHKEEFIKVLERVAYDTEFNSYLLYHGADALEEYDLTGQEKLSILTGDLQWIEAQIGQLTSAQQAWLERRQGAEIW